MSLLNTTIEIVKPETKKLDEEDTVLEEDDYSSEDGSEGDIVDVVELKFRPGMSRGMSTSALLGRKAPSSSSPSRSDLLSRGNSVVNLLSKPTPPSRRISRASSERRLPVPQINDSNMTYLRRKQREENAELWELLRQSKARVEQQQQNNISVKEEENNGSKTSKIEETFEQENRELFDLLQQSKKRLDAAVSKAEQEKAANEKLKANPYMDLHILPEINEDEAITDDDLTTKELLTAMAVAEEAARSGKDTFETPAKEVLRGRDYTSFAFLMEEKEVLDDQQSKEALLIQEERNNCRAIYKVLTKRWDEFEKRATLTMFSLVRQTSKRLFSGFSAQNIEVE